MHKTVTRVPVADLPIALAAMRRWLDRNSCTPLRFTSNRDGDIVSVCVEFTDDTQAQRFTEEFDRAKVLEVQGLASREKHWWLMYDGENSILLSTKDTMARACWCRLMAEEMRAEADGFASSSAKSTMSIVADTWDRIAADIEQRLSKISTRTGA
jgi:hypothetical protein